MEWMNLLEVSKINDNTVDEFKGIKKYVATGGIDYNKIVEFEEVTYESKPSRANREVEIGDILVAKMKDTVKVLKITEENCDEYIFSTGFCILKANQDILDTDYFYYVLISKDFQEQKNKYSKGATQKAINNTGLKKIKIPVPPIKIQKQIVEVLNEAQKLINNRKKQIKLLDDLIESIFYDMFGDPVKNDEGWEVKKLGTVCDMKSGGTPTRKEEKYYKGDIPWITTVALGKLYIGRADAVEFITKEAIENSATKIIPKHSLMIGTRVGVGKVSINQVEMCTNQDIVSLLGLEKSFNMKFIYKQLKTFNEYFLTQVRGATIKGINMRVLRELDIILPPLPLQNQFADKVQAIESQKQLLEKSLKLLEDNYNSLMQRAFKGELF